MSVNYNVHPPIGIDFGTTNSILARYSNSIRMLNTSLLYNHNNNGLDSNRIFFPSMVYADTGDQLIAGNTAYCRRISHPSKVARSVKRTIGSVSHAYTLNARSYTSKEILEVIIKGIFKDPLQTEHNLKPEAVVATIPFYYTQNQIEDTRKGIEGALKDRFPVDTPVLLELLPEPIAAALSFIHQKGLQLDTKTGLVFDFGGGTLDVTLFQYKVSGKEIQFEVLANDGISKFGGDDIDECLEYLILDKTEFSFEGLTPERKMQQLAVIKDHAIECKESFSNPLQTFKEVFFISNLDGQSYTCVVNRSEFINLLKGNNFLNRDFLGEISDSIESLFATAVRTKDEVELILFVGGGSLTYGLQEYVTNLFKHARKIERLDSELIFFSVAKGAALYCAYLLDKMQTPKHFPFGTAIEAIEIITRTTFGLGIELYDGSLDIIIKENTKLPISKTKYYYPVAVPTENGMLQINPLKIIQAKKGNAQIIGSIPFPEIYAHGRILGKNELKISMTFNCITTRLSVNMIVPKGNFDQTDIVIDEALKLNIN